MRQTVPWKQQSVLSFSITLDSRGNRTVRAHDGIEQALEMALVELHNRTRSVIADICRVEELDYLYAPAIFKAAIDFRLIEVSCPGIIGGEHVENCAVDGLGAQRSFPLKRQTARRDHFRLV